MTRFTVSLLVFLGMFVWQWLVRRTPDLSGR